MTYTQCTTPSAPFYHADMVILNTIESMGLDIHCAAIAPLSILAMGAICAASILAILAIKESI